jgi:hypothetical protein
MHCPSSHNRRTDRTKKNNIQVPSTTSYLIWLYQYCRYWKILENTGYTSIADTGSF